MLKGISPLISPDLLSTLHRMGHGDEIALADAHFPGESCNDRVLRADGLTIGSTARCLRKILHDTIPKSPDAGLAGDGS